MDYKEELESLVSSSMAESMTPRYGGASSSIKEITETASSMSKLDLRGQFKEEGRASDSKFEGKYFTMFNEMVVEEDNKKYQIGIVGGKIGEKDSLCREKRSGGLNTFCLKTDCTVNHRNGNAPKIQVDDDDILVLKGSDAAFISPRCSARKVDPEILSEWIVSEATLAEWSNRFMVASIPESGVTSKSDLDKLNKYVKRAEQAKTPKKIPLKFEKVDPFKSSFNRDKVIKEIKLQPGGFGEKTLNYFEEIQKQFDHLEMIVNQLMINSNANVDQILSTLKMIEVEKNKIKRDLGNREEVMINETFDATLV